MATQTDKEPHRQTIPADLASIGYRRQLCVDFSTTVVDLMKNRHSSIPGIEWRRLDFRDMDSVASRSVDVAFDKSGLDAMIHGSPWNPPQEVRDNTAAYLREVRVSVASINGTRFLTAWQPHFTRPLLQQGDLSWKAELKTLGDGSFLEYYGYIMIKSLKGPKSTAEYHNHTYPEPVARCPAERAEHGTARDLSCSQIQNFHSTPALVFFFFARPSGYLPRSSNGLSVMMALKLEQRASKSKWEA